MKKIAGRMMSSGKKHLSKFVLAAAAMLVTSAAHAAGDGTGIQAGLTEMGTDLNTLLTGAGGFVVIIISLGFAAVMVAMGRGFGAVAAAFGVALIFGYGVTAFQGISGVTATAEMLSLHVPQIPIPTIQ